MQKKVLSLVLCLAMMFSIMVVGAGAAFSDQDKIENKEAVDGCVALNIINGIEKDGVVSYKPAQNVTRAEMCKMICVALNSGKAPNLGTATKVSFTDTKDHWAAAYIEACVAKGIVAGFGDGQFKPDDSVTATQAAKMLLIALGYDAKNEGFVGADWNLKVNMVASHKHLYNELEDIDFTAPLNRDNAAQMIWNTLNAVEVEYDYQLVTENGQLVTKPVVKDKNVTLMKDKYDAQVISEAAMLTAAKANTKDGTYTVTVNNKPYTVAQDYSDLLGQNVKVITKGNENPAKQAYGVIVDKDSSVVAAGNMSELDLSKYKQNDPFFTITDGTFDKKGSLNPSATSYDTYKLIDNDGDGKIDGAVVTTVTSAEVSYVSANEIIAGGNTYKTADNNVAEGLAKGDYVAITKNLSTGKNDIVKVEKLTGIVDGIKGEDQDTKVLIDGTWYAKNGKNMDNGKEYDFYAVNGVIVYASVSTGVVDMSNLVMVLNQTTGLITNQAVVMDATGAQKTVNIDKNSDALTNGNLYTYEETADGYKLTKAADAGDYKFVASGDYANSTGTIESDVIADSAVIFVYGGDTNRDGKIITGKQLKNLTDSANIETATQGYFTSTVNGLTRVAYAAVTANDLNELDSVNGKNTNYGYVVETGYTTKIDNVEYVTYTIWNGTENVEVKQATTATTKMPDVGSIVKYDSITDGIINKDAATIKAVADVAKATNNQAAPAAIQGIEGNDLYLDNVVAANKYTMTKDTVKMYIDSNAAKAADIGKASGDIQLATKYANNIWMDNVIVVTNGKNEILLIVVDVKNNMTTAKNTTYAVTTPAITNATVTVSKDKGLKAGDSFEMTVTANKKTNATTLNLSGARLSDGTSQITVPEMKKGGTYTVTLFVTGRAPTVTFTAP